MIIAVFVLHEFRQLYVMGGGKDLNPAVRKMIQDLRGGADPLDRIGPPQNFIHAA